MQDKLQRLRQEREEEMKKRVETYDPSKYRTEWQREMLEKEAMEKEAKIKDAEIKKEKFDKMLQYDEKRK